jgi:molecular chaperone GrpE (heat shock protein)
VQEQDVLNLVGQLEGDIDKEHAAYKQVEEQLRQLKDQYRRLQADFDNFRSRAVRTLPPVVMS